MELVTPAIGAPKGKSSLEFSPEIQTALFDTSAALQGFVQKLNSVSSDIKNLESLLQSYGICVPVVMKLNSLGFFSRNDGDYYFEKANHLAWIEDAHGTFRLMYCEGEQKAWKSESGSFTVKHGLENIWFRESTPLIETKAKVRLDVHAYLPTFLHEVRNVVAPEEIPF